MRAATLVYNTFFIFLVILITGGFNGDTLKSAEIFNPDPCSLQGGCPKTSCSLPELPEARRLHSQDGGLACGGLTNNAATNICFKWSPSNGTWTQSHTLDLNPVTHTYRSGHVSWATASGVYLIGGFYTVKTSQKVKLDGSVEKSFSLKYETRFLHSSFHYQLSDYLSLTGMHALSLTLTTRK